MSHGEYELTPIGRVIYVLAWIGIAVMTWVSIMRAVEDGYSQSQARLDWIVSHPEEAPKLKALAEAGRLEEYVRARIEAEKTAKAIKEFDR